MEGMSHYWFNPSGKFRLGEFLKERMRKENPSSGCQVNLSVSSQVKLTFKK